MTPAETESLYNFGALLKIAIVDLPMRGVVCGMCILLFFISTIRFIHRGFSNRVNKVLFVISIINLLAIIAFMIPAIVCELTIVDVYLFSSADVPIPARGAIAAHDPVIRALNIILFWSNIIPVIITDAVLVWRAWTILQKQVELFVVPVLLLLGTTVTMVTCGGMFSSVDTPSNLPKAFSLIYTCGVGLSLLTNIVVTSLIVYKLWSYRESTAKVLDAIRLQRSPVERALSILIESGAIYCAFQVAALIINVYGSIAPPSNMLWIAGKVFTFILICISGMYPTLIIVIVDAGSSFADTYVPDIAYDRKTGLDGGSVRRATAGHLTFAVPPLQTTDEIGGSLLHSSLADSIVVNGESGVGECKGRVSSGAGLA